MQSHIQMRCVRETEIGISVLHQRFSPVDLKYIKHSKYLRLRHSLPYHRLTICNESSETMRPNQEDPALPLRPAKRQLSCSWLDSSSLSCTSSRLLKSHNEHSPFWSCSRIGRNASNCQDIHSSIGCSHRSYKLPTRRWGLLIMSLRWTLAQQGMTCRGHLPLPTREISLSPAWMRIVKRASERAESCRQHLMWGGAEALSVKSSSSPGQIGCRKWVCKCTQESECSVSCLTAQVNPAGSHSSSGKSWECNEKGLKSHQELLNPNNKCITAFLCAHLAWCRLTFVGDFLPKYRPWMLLAYVGGADYPLKNKMPGHSKTNNHCSCTELQSEPSRSCA